MSSYQASTAATPYSKEIIIAFFSLAFILLYLVFRYLFHFVPSIQNIPLYLILLFGGIPLVVGLTRQLLQFEFSSDSLAGISIVTSVLLDQYLAGALVVLMLSGGQALELFAVRQASFLLEALSKRMPHTAHRKNGTIQDVPISQVEVGDLLVIYPHEICPVDGQVIEGHGVMDEAYLTGEPFLISKTPGTSVMSGAVNGDSLLTIQASRKASDSRYAKIMQVMLESEQNKPKMRRLADWLGAFYTPLALIIAIAAWLASGEAIRFLAVLVIATPCPLLIAIPVAIIGAISLSAKKGIIIKNPVALEQIDRCQIMIFDKTGTLTYGKPALTEAIYYPPFSAAEALGLAASIERYSKHPLSSAILDAAAQQGIPSEEAASISEKPGEGLSGTVQNHQVVLTSRRNLIKQKQFSIVDQLPETSGLECVLLIDGQLAAHFCFHDAPRKESRSFIAHLSPKHQFERVMIVSGDQEREVKYLANQIGVQHIYAGKTPEEKVQIVQNEARNKKVIYLGDGINDAPALAAATVGIAFGQNSDITTEAADAVLMDNTLEKVDELLHISRRMRRIALQSAVGGMALSIVGMFVAAFGFLPPVLGAISQELIDILAVLNALRVPFPKNSLTDFTTTKGIK